MAECETRRGVAGTVVHVSKFTDKPGNTVWAQAQAGVHQGTSATCGCSFLIPSLSQSSATAAPAAVPAVETSTVTASQPGQGAQRLLGRGSMENALQI